MPEILDLKNAVEGVVSSYESRIGSISSLFETTLLTNHLVLGKFQESLLDTKEEREEINVQLRDALTRNEHLRRKDFDQMMQGILLTQKEREREVRNLLDTYLDEQKEMAQALKENLKEFSDSVTKGETLRVQEFQAWLGNILAKQNERKDEVVSRLKEFGEEQKELALKSKELLAEGTKLRIRDLKLMLKEFKAQHKERTARQQERSEEVRDMLNGFKNKKVPASNSWIPSKKGG